MPDISKPDLERLGYFKEQSYHTIGDPYVDQNRFTFNEAASKGRQLYGTQTKSKSGLNDGYFTNFNRTFTGEGLTDLGKLKHQERLKSKIKNGNRIFFPPAGSKSLLGSGSYWGTFTEPIKHFSGQLTEYKPMATKRNFYTNPPQQGTGFGFACVTIGKYPSYKSEPYLDHLVDKTEIERHKTLMTGRKKFILSGNIDFFWQNPYKLENEQIIKTSVLSKKTAKPLIPFRPSNPAKLPGGYKAGTFNPFPKYISDLYIDPYKMRKPIMESKRFLPSSGPKSCRFESILSRNVKKCINSTNYGSVSSVIYGS